MITRTIQKEIESCFFKGKAVILLGARQVGKTTLVREIARSYKGPSLYLWGALWENFIISERWKFLSNSGRQVNRYFWRTHSQQEIDLIEESGGQLDGYEIKWREGKIRGAKAFLAGYPESKISLITQENYREFVGIQAG